ncbi:NAD(P)-binding domain-containing protein [Rhodococcus erythropolis]|uniref:NAD(P)-binding domain-containing protein n=1 Tax=Rhodococcus erythropolis TaxID=1833 RepID=UPI001BEBCC9F|nr:NAD(P)-binding domain-containing protein [Rhodococcus erythropolis]MBT2266041.1 NAD(P)-dependent oxidoreductase [Rhodococcus erythropolis]
MTRLTLLGTGLMGTAVGQSLLAAGHELHIWNRTKERAASLQDNGAIFHNTPDDAIGHGDVVILLLLNHEIAKTILRTVADRLRGKDVLDLITSTPRQVEDVATRTRLAGGAYLAGAIQSFPDDIGTKDALIYFSGDEATWQRQQHVLRVIAPIANLLSTQAEAAAKVDAALSGAFGTTAMGAWLEALSFLADEGFTLKSTGFRIEQWARQFAAEMALAANEVARDDFATDQATLAVNAAAVASWRQTLVAGGHRADIMTAALRTLERAVDAGHGGDSWAAQARVLRRRD